MNGIEEIHRIRSEALQKYDFTILDYKCRFLSGSILTLQVKYYQPDFSNFIYASNFIFSACLNPYVLQNVSQN